MFRTSWISCVLIGATLATIAEADAQLFRRRRNANGNTTYNSYGNTYSQPIGAGIDASPELRSLDAVYDYDLGKKRDAAFGDKVDVHLRIADTEVLESKRPIVAEISVADLRDDDKTVTCFAPVSINYEEKGQYKPATFSISNEDAKPAVLAPASVYQMTVKLHRQSERYNRKTALGEMSFPYYVATPGESRLDKARQQIVMRTFREWYYAKQGWQTDEYYAMDCYAFYMWATGFCTRGATNGHTNLWLLFDATTPFHSGSEITGLAKKHAIHGDYVRMPGHSFMLLAHDSDEGKVWTMEGNYGATIEIVTRYVDPGWTVGHLHQRHLRRGMFRARRGGIAARGAQTASGTAGAD